MEPDGNGVCRVEVRGATQRGATLDSIVPAKRIKQSVEFESDDAAFAGEMMMTWAFDATASATRVTVSADNVPSGISKSDHETGLKSTVDNLARFVAGK